MIDMRIGPVKEPWYRRLLRLKPRTWIYIQLPNGDTDPIARFVDQYTQEMYLVWLSQQGTEIAQVISSVLEMERGGKGIEPKPRPRVTEYNEENSLG